VAARGKPDARRQANRFGLRAEWIAAIWLALKGYRILVRRFQVAGGEIDIVARRGDVVAFVEVKARRSSTTRPPRSARPSAAGCRGPRACG
jgi:Holliday junction resolvase-like predicted endonuclease